MLGQIFFGGKKHPWWRYVFVGTLALAVAGFEFLKPSKHGHSSASASKALGGGSEDDDGSALWASMYGYILLTVSLLCDSFTGPTQDKLLPSMGIDGVQLMAWQNLWAALFAGIGLAVRGSAADSIAFFQRHPDRLNDFVLFLITSATGQFFIFGTLALYDSLVLTTVTTVRKFVTILVSVLRFGHQQSIGQWLMVALVFGSILGDKLVSVWTGEGRHHHHHHQHPHQHPHEKQSDAGQHPKKTHDGDHAPRDAAGPQEQPQQATAAEDSRVAHVADRSVAPDESGRREQETRKRRSKRDD
jgi:drug/metabolite transporter (DMT)-like permease